MRVSVLIWSSESFLYEPLSNQYGQPVRIFGFLSNCKSFSWEMEYYFVQRFIWISMWVVKRNVIAYFKHSCNMRGCLSVIFIPGVIGSFRFLKAIVFQATQLEGIITSQISFPSSLFWICKIWLGWILFGNQPMKIGFTVTAVIEFFPSLFFYLTGKLFGFLLIRFVLFFCYEFVNYNNYVKIITS